MPLKKQFPISHMGMNDTNEQNGKEYYGQDIGLSTEELGKICGGRRKSELTVLSSLTEL